MTSPSKLEPQEFEIPLTLGMATKPAAELQEPTHMRLVQNLHWRELGALENRPADDTDEALAIPSGGNYDLDEACGLIVHDKKPLVVTGRYGVAEFDPVRGAFQYARGAVAASSSPSDSLKYCPVSYDVTRRFVERTQLNRGELGIFNVASAQYNGIHVIAWIVLSNATHYLNMKAIRVDTGEVVATTEQQSIASTAQFFVQACEYTESGKEGVLLAYVNDAASPYTVSTIRYDYASNEFVADSDLATNAVTQTFVIVKNGDGIYFAYHDNATGFLKVEDRTISTVASTHTATHGAVCVDLVVGASNTLIASCTTTTTYVEVFGDPANVQTLLAVAASETFYKVTVAAESLSGGSHDAVVFATLITSATKISSMVRARQVRFDTTTPAPSAGPAVTIPHCFTVANAFTLRGMAHVIMTVYPRLNGLNPTEPTSCFVARYRSGGATDQRLDVVAKIAHDRFFISNYLTFDVATLGRSKQGVSVYVDADNSAWLALTADPSSVPAFGTYLFPQSIFLARIDATRPMPMAYAQPEPGVTFVAGAMPWEYDGDSAAECTPLVTPRALADVTAAGSASAATGYSIRLVYEWVDARGRLKRMPGPSIFTGIFTTQQLDIYATVCPMRAFDEEGFTGDMTPKLYITADGGSTYYLAVDSTGNVRTHDSTTSDGLYYLFSDVDPTAISSVPWPFGDSEIEPEPTPGFAHVCKIADRMWAIDMEDRSRIWFSKPLLAGFGVEWSTLCTLFIGDEAVAVIDVGGYPTILARGGIYQIGGPGPDANNVGSFSPAQRLPFEVECLDAVSVCRTPIGIVFRGRRGLYALADGPRSEPGLLIDPEMLTEPDTAEPRTRVVFQEQTNEIHCITPDGDRLVYNVVEQKWSKYTDGVGVDCRDLAVARGKVWRLEMDLVDYLRSDKLYSEDGPSYNESDRATEVRTPWIKLDGLAGQQRLWRTWIALTLPSDVATNVSSLRVQFYANNSETVSSTKTWTGAELAAYAASGIVRLPFAPNVQLVHSFRFHVACFLADPSAGMRPLALRCQVGVRPSKGKRNSLQIKG